MDDFSVEPDDATMKMFAKFSVAKILSKTRPVFKII